MLAGNVIAKENETSPSFNFSLGAGAAYLPKFSGADEYEVKAIPMIQLDYGNVTFGGAGGISYRFINNKELYDLYKDPGQKQNIASQHPEIVAKIQKAYPQWWKNVKPYMVNENVPLAQEKPFWVDYKKQQELKGIENCVVPNLN